ncbi:hypothetical protein ACSTJN_23635, partial [Vibrio parahaemolyticus]
IERFIGGFEDQSHRPGSNLFDVTITVAEDMNGNGYVRVNWLILGFLWRRRRLRFPLQQSLQTGRQIMRVERLRNLIV